MRNSCKSMIGYIGHLTFVTQASIVAKLNPYYMTFELETIIGILGAILSSLSFLPQVIKIWKTKSADDLSMPTIVLLAANAATWLAYGLIKDAMPLAITNALMLSMLLVIIFFKIKFSFCKLC